MFTDSGICWVIWCVSAFAFRWFSLQGDKFDSFDYSLTPNTKIVVLVFPAIDGRHKSDKASFHKIKNK